MVLMYDPQTQTLSLNPKIEPPAQWAGFSLRLAPESKLAEAIAGSRPAFLSQGSTPSAEEPLFKVLDAKIVAGIPLVKSGVCVGVLIGKIPFLKIADLRTNLRFIQVFGTQAATALLALRAKQQEMKTVADNAVDEFKLTSRKIVHEANNPLTVIRNYLRVLNDKLNSQQPIGTEISMLSEEIERVSRIIQKLVDPQPDKTASLTNINQIIEDIARMLRDSGFAPASLHIRTRGDEYAHTTECDDGKIWQIMLNLLKNAVEAMPTGGEIQINNKGHVNQNGRLYIDIEIRDTGPGMPSDIMESMFTPVTSQKGGKHQGLGLAIVHDLVKELNGFISCRSSPDGTAFAILLPVRATRTANEAH
jgi:nitrogen-specific signal transduction histidine kinase